MFLSLTISGEAYAKTLSKLKTHLVGAESFEMISETVSSGSVLFEQTLIPTGIVKLSEEREIFIRKTGNTNINFVAGALLYKVTDKNGVEVYCSFTPTFLATPRFGKPIELVSCLLDEDKDGKFERVFISEKGQLDLVPYVHYTLREQKKPFEPIPYTASNMSPVSNMSSRVLYKGMKKGELVFDLQIESEEGEWLDHARELVNPTDVQQTFSIFGAEIKIENISDGILFAHVIMGISSERSFELTTSMSAKSKKPLVFSAP